MTRQFPRYGYRDLPVAALVQVRGAHVRMVQHRPGVRKRKNVIGHEHKTLIKEGKPLPPWHTVNIKCHDFRVTFCTMCYDAGIPMKTLQKWMGHSDATMIMHVYAKLTNEKEQADIAAINNYRKERFAT